MSFFVRPTGAVPVALGSALLLAVAACAPRDHQNSLPVATRTPGTVVTVRDTTLIATFDASGVAAPMQQSTLSTKIMGTVIAVFVQEGDAVAAGQPLVRIDARDLAAKSAQVSASIADAEAMRRDAITQANRVRALYADSAATRSQLDAVETGLARAEAGVRAAHAAAGEVGAMTSYATIRAPFAGIVTKRFVDAGAFAAPGAPLVSVQDASTLRITANAAPDAVRGVRRGQSIAATIEGRQVAATVEGVVPATSGNMYTVNALVANPARAILAGSAATLALPAGARATRVIPEAAVTREGDLTGVTLRTATGDETRWVRLGRTSGDVVEVIAGLRPGDRVVVPTPHAPRAVPTADAAPLRAGEN